MFNKKRILKGIRSLQKEKKEHEIKRRIEIAKDKDNPVIGYWDKEIDEMDRKIKEKKAKLRRKF